MKCFILELKFTLFYEQRYLPLITVWNIQFVVQFKTQLYLLGLEEQIFWRMNFICLFVFQD